MSSGIDFQRLRRENQTLWSKTPFRLLDFSLAEYVSELEAWGYTHHQDVPDKHPMLYKFQIAFNAMPFAIRSQWINELTGPHWQNRDPGMIILQQSTGWATFINVETLGMSSQYFALKAPNQMVVSSDAEIFFSACPYGMGASRQKKLSKLMDFQVREDFDAVDEIVSRLKFTWDSGDAVTRDYMRQHLQHILEVGGEV